VTFAAIVVNVNVRFRGLLDPSFGCWSHTTQSLG